MNIAQRLILAIGGVAVALMALFPPWLYVYNYDPVNQDRGFSAQLIERPAGYHAIWGPHVPTDSTALGTMFSVTVERYYPDRLDLKYFSMKLDKDRFWIQIVGVVLASAFFYFLLRKPTKQLG